MPVDIHPKEKISGVELILTRLHAGGKFSDKNYQFAGGLHGVGVSVVNALSKNLECWVQARRQGIQHQLQGRTRKSKLEVVGTVGKNNTGTTVRFWPDPQFFDSDKFSVPKLKHVLRAKAVLCPGLRVTLKIETAARRTSGSTPAASRNTCSSSSAGRVAAAGTVQRQRQGRTRSGRVGRRLAARRRARRHRELRQPDPDAEGGTHVNGLRIGLADAMREFCEFRNLLPRGLKLAPEDVWDGVSYVLSIKMQEPAVRRARPRSGSPRASPRRSSAASSRMPSRCGSTSIRRRARRSRSSRSPMRRRA